MIIEGYLLEGKRRKAYEKIKTTYVAICLYLEMSDNAVSQIETSALSTNYTEKEI